MRARENRAAYTWTMIRRHFQDAVRTSTLRKAASCSFSRLSELPQSLNPQKDQKFSWVQALFRT